MIWSSTSNWHSLMLPSPFVNSAQLIYNTLLIKGFSYWLTSLPIEQHGTQR